MASKRVPVEREINVRDWLGYDTSPHVCTAPNMLWWRSTRNDRWVMLGKHRDKHYRPSCGGGFFVQTHIFPFDRKDYG